MSGNLPYQIVGAVFGVWLLCGFACVFPYIDYRRSQNDDSPFLDGGPLMRPMAKFKMLLDIDMYQPAPLQIGLWFYRALTATCVICVVMAAAGQLRAAG